LLPADPPVRDRGGIRERFGIPFGSPAILARDIGLVHRLRLLSGPTREQMSAPSQPDQSCSALGVRRICVPLDLFPASDGERGGKSSGKVIPMKRKHIVGAIIAVVVLVALFYFYGGSQTPSGQAPLRSLTAQNIGEIRDQLNAAKSDVRVLLLLSPT
jgi:hypothetical protein